METTQPAIKHWRSFGASDWQHVREGALGLVLGSLVPVGLFYVSFRAWGFAVAVIAVLCWSTLVFIWHFRRTGGLDVFSATTFAFACIKASAGVASGNKDLYLAWPSLENLIYGTAFFASALLGRPLLALYAERLYPIPAHVRTSQAFKRAFLMVSAAWLCGHAFRALLRLWLKFIVFPQDDDLGLYLIADTVAGWPINISLVALTAWFPLRQLRRAGFMSVTPRPIAAIDAAGLAVEETAPTTV